MRDREAVIEFSRGVMDRIRDYCSIPPLDDVRQPDGSWRFVHPSGERLFRVIPHGRLMLKNGKDWTCIAHVRNEAEAQIAIDNFLVGC